MCSCNKINFQGQNFQIEKFNVSSLGYLGTSFDMHAVLKGLCIACSENLEACVNCYEHYKQGIFQSTQLLEKDLSELPMLLQTLDTELGKFLPREKIWEIRDGIDFRTLEEPIYQLINLYQKLNGNLKRHPMTDKEKGYKELLARCNRFLEYIIQSLEMLGVEVISESGKKFNPDKNKVADDEPVSLNSVVSKVNKFGFAYKGKIIEKAEVEVKKSYFPGSNFGGSKK